MPCLIALLALIGPRVALVGVWLFSGMIDRAFDGIVLPILGFLLLPWTTLAFVVMYDIGTNEVTGFEWFVVVLAFLGDLGAYGGGSKARDRD